MSKRINDETLHQARLAKNRIAREIAASRRANHPFGEFSNLEWLIEDLKTIETAIGRGNQPTVQETLDSKYL